MIFSEVLTFQVFQILDLVSGLWGVLAFRKSNGRSWNISLLNYIRRGSRGGGVEGRDPPPPCSRPPIFFFNKLNLMFINPRPPRRRGRERRPLYTAVVAPLQKILDPRLYIVIFLSGMVTFSLSYSTSRSYETLWKRVWAVYLCLTSVSSIRNMYVSAGEIKCCPQLICLQVYWRYYHRGPRKVTAVSNRILTPIIT